MIGFAMVGTNDLLRARSFYDPLMPLLGAAVKTAWSTETRVWYMTAPNAPMLVVTKPYDGQPATAGNGSMTALVVRSREAVHAVHAKALDLGGAPTRALLAIAAPIRVTYIAPTFATSTGTSSWCSRCRQLSRRHPDLVSH